MPINCRMGSRISEGPTCQLSGSLLQYPADVISNNAGILCLRLILSHLKGIPPVTAFVAWTTALESSLSPRFVWTISPRTCLFGNLVLKALRPMTSPNFPKSALTPPKKFHLTRNCPWYVIAVSMPQMLLRPAAGSPTFPGSSQLGLSLLKRHTTTRKCPAALQLF